MRLTSNMLDKGWRGAACVACTVLLSSFLLGAAAPHQALADNRLEGYYSLSIAAQKDDTRWHFGSPDENGIPRHYAELKFFSNPNDQLEVFSKLRAWSNRDDNSTSQVEFYRPPWYSAEGHIKIHNKKWESYIFYRQNRFYVNDEPLLRLIDDNKLKNDSYGPMAQGVRVDFWDTDFLGVKGLGGTMIISDSGSTVPFGDTYYVTRLRHKAWGQRITSGAMYLRKDYLYDSENPIKPNNQVYSADVTFSPRNLVHTGLRLGPVNLEQSRWTAEAAWSIRPGDEERYHASRARARAIALETRNIVISDLTLNAWYNDFGEDFRSYLSSRFDDAHEYNRVQKHAEAYWLVPKKSVTAKVTYDHYRKRIADEPGGGLRPATEWYAELYMEYINGFKSRIAYKRWHGFDQSSEVNDFYTYPDWFGEISVENFLAKIRIQGRIHDAGTFRQVTAWGFDMQVNITDKLKGYLRALNVNEKTEARQTLFAQLKYDLGWGADLYFEFGDPGQSDNLVYTWFVEEDKNNTLSNRIKLTLSAWF